MELSVKDCFTCRPFAGTGNFKDFNLKKNSCVRSPFRTRNVKPSVFTRMPRTSARMDVGEGKPFCRGVLGDEMEYLRKACERISDEWNFGRYVGYQNRASTFHSGEVKPSFPPLPLPKDCPVMYS